MTKAPVEVPEGIANDYKEAQLVLKLSSQASAALSRRCMEHILIEQGAPEQEKLVKQVEWAKQTAPSSLADFLDEVRKLGNIAAHPKGDVVSANIVQVEPKEAELMIRTLEEMFDFYYVKPARSKRDLETLRKKTSLRQKPTK